MKIATLVSTCGILSLTPTLFAFDDFNLQMSKLQHEQTSWSHDIYTVSPDVRPEGTPWAWLQQPAIAARVNYTHQDRFDGFYKSDLVSPMVDFSFQTIGGVNVGVAYSHGFLSEEQIFIPGLPSPVKFEGDQDSVGAYVAKQWDCGLKVGGTWSYSSAKIAFKDYNFTRADYDTVGASGMIGFARSFGQKKFGKNVFVDTSANFLNQSEEQSWNFLWMAKVGHNLCREFAVYGIFNLFHELEHGESFRIPVGYAGYHPLGETTWGEAGGGVQAQLGHGFSLTAEATTPVICESPGDIAAVQLRAAVNWVF